MRARPASRIIVMLKGGRGKQLVMVNSHTQQTFSRLETLLPRGATMSCFASRFLLLLVILGLTTDMALHSASTLCLKAGQLKGQAKHPGISMHRHEKQKAAQSAANAHAIRDSNNCRCMPMHETRSHLSKARDRF